MDLDQTGECHRNCNVLVVPIGGISSVNFQKLFALMQKSYSHLPGPTDIRLTLLNASPSQKWNDFQFHRRILGIIGVSDFSDPSSKPREDSYLASSRLQELRGMHATVLQTCCLGFNLAKV